MERERCREVMVRREGRGGREEEVDMVVVGGGGGGVRWGSVD